MASPTRRAETIDRALPLLGFGEVEHLHVGKLFRFTLEAPDPETARVRAEQLCDRLLANPVIERSTVEIAPAAGAGERDGPVSTGTAVSPGPAGTAGTAGPAGTGAAS